MGSSSSTPPRFVDQLGVHPDGIPDVFSGLSRLEVGVLEQLTPADLRETQDQDSIISVIKRAIETAEEMHVSF